MAKSFIDRIIKTVKELFIQKKRVKRSVSLRKVQRKKKALKRVSKTSHSIKVSRKRGAKTGEKKLNVTLKSVKKQSTLKKKVEKPGLAELKRIRVGVVTHYFDKIKVCVVRIDQLGLKRGDRIDIEGKHGVLVQMVNSLQVKNEDVVSASKGQMVGLKVDKVVAVGSIVKLLK